VKEKIKKSMMMLLICKDIALRKSISGLIGVIAAIEIPRKEWLDLVDTLCKNTTHQNFDIKRTSIETIGEICANLVNPLPHPRTPPSPPTRKPRPS
jgi:importin subunit beta-1